MIITQERTVAEIVTENIKTADIFKKHGIDFCCGGGITIEKACDKNGVNYKTLEKELTDVDAIVSRAHDYDSWNLTFLIDHIMQVHHTYVTDSIPIILQYADKVAKVHGHHYHEVVEINGLFIEIAQELSSHLQKEEVILFPYVKELEKAVSEGKTSIKPPFGTVNNPIQVMENEHESAGDLFKIIAKLSNNYTPPTEACNTFKALYAKLKEFEQDLHQHIHLENNILFPKSIQLEEQLN